MSVAFEMFLAAVVIGLLGGGSAGIVMKNGGHGLIMAQRKLWRAHA